MPKYCGKCHKLMSDSDEGSWIADPSPIGEIKVCKSCFEEHVKDMSPS